jgi:hypothetical protein
MRSAKHLVTLAREGWEYRNWYADCLPILDEAASRLQVDTKRLTDVMAITSPRCAVKRNVRYTVRYLRTGTLPSDAIHTTGLALQHYEDTGEIRGPKTSEFAKALGS